MLDLDSLQLFVRAAEQGSLSKAANQANLALAAVSRRIAILEEYYGVPLLDRNGRGVSLTPAGKVLLERAHNILLKVRETKADLSDFATGLKGTVSLHACTSAISQFLPNDLALFAQTSPDVRIDVREAYSSDIVASVRNGASDVGVIMAGASVDGLSTAPYRRDHLVVVARKEFSPKLKQAHFKDLTDQDLVMMEDNTSISRLLYSIAAESGLVLRPRVKVGSFDAVCRMIESGFGIGVLPQGAARNFERPLNLRLIDLKDTWAERQMLVCTSSLHRRGVAADNLVKLLSRGGE